MRADTTTRDTTKPSVVQRGTRTASASSVRRRSVADGADEAAGDQQAEEHQRLEERHTEDEGHEDLARRRRIARDALESGAGGAALADAAAEGREADGEAGADGPARLGLAAVLVLREGGGR